MSALHRTQLPILLVDDVPANLLALGAVLEPLGYRLVQATSGAEAVVRVREEPFALVIMDVQMPVLDGFETASLMRTHPHARDVPFIFLTATDPAPALVERGYALGAVDFVTKPFEPTVLRAKVRSHVDHFMRAELVRRQADEIVKKEREAQRAHASRLAAEAATRAKDEFLAMVSHELRTPLNAVIGWVELLRSRQLSPERIAMALETIARNAKSQARLIDDLLDVARMVNGKLHLSPERTDLAAIVRNAVDSIRPSAAAKQIILTLEGVDRCIVEADTHRIEQVFWNLLTNAVKFTPQGGAIQVRLRCTADQIELEVEDDGSGISASDLPHVFERFRQGERAQSLGGLGLGLAIAQHIVELHRGSIDVQSAGVGQGSRFIVRLPTGGGEPAPAAVVDARGQ